MLRHVDLCSGIGGFSLGFSWAELSKTIMFCDTEEWCRQILNKNFPNIPIATDVKELANDPERNVPDHDILTAGYPCQPFSVAGLRKGEKDDRHIWPYIFRIVTHKRPSWCVFENVYGHVALGLDKVLADLESQGYATRTFIVPACAKIIAKNVEDSIGGRCEERDSKSQEVSRSICTSPGDGDGATLGDSSSGGRRGFQISGEQIGNSESEEAQSLGSSGVRADVGDTQHNGSSTPKERGSNEEDARRASKGEIEAKQSEGTSGREHYETMAYTKCLGWEQRSEEQGEFDREESSDQFDFGSEGCDGSETSTHVAYTSSEGLQGRSLNSTISKGRAKESQLGNESSRISTDQGIWFAEPNVGRVAHGISKRVDRLKGLGNAIVPQIAMQIGLAIKAEINENKKS